MGEVDIGGLIVEWDDEKYRLNVKKHGIYFEDAARIFLDENRIKIMMNCTAITRTDGRL